MTRYGRRFARFLAKTRLLVRPLGQVEVAVAAAAVAAMAQQTTHCDHCRIAAMVGMAKASAVRKAVVFTKVVRVIRIARKKATTT